MRSSNALTLDSTPLAPEFHLCDYPHPPMWAQVPLKADIRKMGSLQQTISEEPSPTMDLNRGAVYCRAKQLLATINIEKVKSIIRNNFLPRSEDDVSQQ